MRQLFQNLTSKTMSIIDYEIIFMNHETVNLTRRGRARSPLAHDNFHTTFHKSFLVTVKSHIIHKFSSEHCFVIVVKIEASI